MSRLWKVIGAVGVIAALSGCQQCQRQAVPSQADGASAPSGAGPGDTAPTSESQATKAPGPTALPSTGATGVWPLLAAAHRAELDASGLFIDFGTGDEHKYTRGGWLTGWGEAPQGDVAMRQVRDATATLTALLDKNQAPQVLAARLRSDVPGQQVTATLDGTPLGQAAVTSAWKVVRVPVPPASRRPGEHTLVLSFSQALPGKPRAEVDWLWLQSSAGTPPPPTGPRAAPVRLGKTTRRALVAPGPCRYAFYLEIPRGAKLSMSYGAKQATRFEVRATVDGTAPRQLLQATATPGKWQESTIDLAPLAGEMARVELVTTGPAGEAGWAEPEIVFAAVSGQATGGPVGSGDSAPGKATDTRSPAPGAKAGSSAPGAKAGSPTPNAKAGSSAPGAKAESAGAKAGSPAPRAATESPRARHVVLVVTDAARANLYQPFDPRSQVQAKAVAQLAKEGTVVSHAWATAAWTKPSVTSMLTGLYPQTHRISADRHKLTPTMPFLPQRLQGAGFRTGLFNDNPYIGEDHGYARGWDLFRAYKKEGKATGADWWNAKTDPGRLYQEALDWMAQQKGKRLFVMVHNMATHAPYRKLPGCTDLYHPKPYAGQWGSAIDAPTLYRLTCGDPMLQALVKPADKEWFRALYRGEATCHDRQLATFVEGLRKLKILDDTLLIVLADHGEELDDHGRWGHFHSLYEELLRVPVVVRHPRLFPAGGRLDVPVDLVDLAPTIFEAVGVDPPDSLEGESLLARLRGDAVLWPATALAEQPVIRRGRALRTTRYKYVFVDQKFPPRPPWHRQAGPWPPPQMGSGSYLFDLAKDPKESRNLLGEKPVARRGCEILLAEALAVPVKSRRLWAPTTSRRHFQSSEAPLSPEIRRQLEALGYVTE